MRIHDDKTLMLPDRRGNNRVDLLRNIVRNPQVVVLLATSAGIATAPERMLPDRRGNNRIDSLRNIVRNPQVALLFLIPGVANTLRINGRAHLSVAPALLLLAVEDKAPRSVMVMDVETIYFQCGRALIRSELSGPPAPCRSEEPAERRPDPGRAERGRVGGTCSTTANGPAAPPRRCGERLERFPGRWPGNARTIDADYTGHIPFGRFQPNGVCSRPPRAAPTGPSPG